MLKSMFDDGYNVLKSVRADAATDNLEYWQTYSDFAWVMGDFRGSYEAARFLYDSGNYTQIEAERICQFIRDDDPALAESVAKAGWKKFGDTYLFFLYAGIAMELGSWKELSGMLDDLSGEELNRLKKVSVFYQICGEIMRNTGRLKRAKEYFIEYARLNPDSIAASATLLWFLVDTKDFSGIELLLFDLERKGRIKNELLVPSAAGYFMLQKIDKSYRLLREAFDSGYGDPFVRSFYADVLDAMERREESEKILMGIWGEVTELVEKGYDIAQDPFLFGLFARLYVRFETPANVMRFMERIKGEIPEAEYLEMKMAWHLGNEGHDAVKLLSNKYTGTRKWILLNLALNSDDRYKQRELVFDHWKILPARDRVEALVRTGDISRAQDLVFLGLDDNSNDHLLYQQMRDLYMESSDTFKFDTSFTRREDLDYYSFNTAVMKHIENTFFLKADADYRSQSSNDDDNLDNIPAQDISGSLSAFFKDDDGFFELGVGRREAVREFFFYKLTYTDRLDNYLNLNINAGYDVMADESQFIVVGGMKNMAEASLEYLLTDRFSLRGTLEYDVFRSQDRERLGTGKVAALEFAQRWCAGYPDFTTRVFAAKSSYDDNNKTGIISKLTPLTDFDILPDSSVEVGAGFSLGIENREIYTRVWRPFLDASASYNTAFGMGYSAGAGIGGMLFGEDHLSAGINYSVGQIDFEAPIITVFLRYLLLF